ncbi:hypothetical protein LIER_37827 [Lithospermum erythrorhizon]|uniref:Uncharacterized protein n=1 Tax=Lithospermum erythrorhizon TaxID=34254 RepID=A0AAV3PVG7_LITER
MSYEIEVVEEEVAVTGRAAAAEEESLKNDVYTAATYGDMDKLRRLVESEGIWISSDIALSSSKTSIALATLTYRRSR